ncbi:MAG: hypothetical protein M3Q71_00150 [Chloroflexota bacterium]|nr:hypothetical protein [Chloroflexota bacterium]
MTERSTTVLLPVAEGFPIDALLQKGRQTMAKVPADFFDLSEERQADLIGSIAFE